MSVCTLKQNIGGISHSFTKIKLNRNVSRSDWKCAPVPGTYISVKPLRPRQNGRHFTDDTFKRIFVNENVRVLIEISLKFVPKGPINNIPALIQIMAWRRPGDKPLSEPMMVCLPTHICVTRPQWVKPVKMNISSKYQKVDVIFFPRWANRLPGVRLQAPQSPGGPLVCERPVARTGQFRRNWAWKRSC